MGRERRARGLERGMSYRDVTTGIVLLVIVFVAGVAFGAWLG